MDFLKSTIKEITDFPQEGINYKDISTLLANGRAFRQSIHELAVQCRHKQVDLVVCPKTRSLTIGAPLAFLVGAGLVVLGKPDRLHEYTVCLDGDSEFADRPMFVSAGVIKPGMKVLIVDDLLATGRTAAAAVKLVEDNGGEVTGTVFLIELTGLGGRVKLMEYDTISLIQYNY